MKNKMPKPYLSCSAYKLFLKDPLEFYQQYYIARLDEPTPKMTLGKIFQEAWCDDAYPFVRELRRAGFTPDHARIVSTAVHHPQTVRLPKRDTERTFTVKHKALAHPILAIYDGWKPKDKLIVENKYGVVWSLERCKDEVQFKWYSLVCRYKFGYIPKILVQSFNSKTGIPTKYLIKHTAAELDALVSDINNVVARIKAGDFQQR